MFDCLVLFDRHEEDEWDTQDDGDWQDVKCISGDDRVCENPSIYPTQDLESIDFAIVADILSWLLLKEVSQASVVLSQNWTVCDLFSIDGDCSLC